LSHTRGHLSTKHMDIALSACLALAQRVYEAAKAARENKEQARLLGERVARLSEQLQRMVGAKVRSACVDELHNTLEAALELVDNRYKDNSNYFFKLLRSGANKERFEAIFERLQRVQGDLGVQLVADVGELAAQVRQAAVADQREFDKLMQSIQSNHQEGLAHVMEVKADTQEVMTEMKRLQEMVLALRPVSATVSSSISSQASASSPSMPAAEPVASAHEPPPQWRLSFKAIVFEKDEDGDKISLGRGAFGEVFKATIGGKLAAVKTFAHAVLRVPRNREMFLAEVRLLHSLHHPSLIEMYGASEVSEGKAVPFIAMEFLPKSLFDTLYVEQGPSPIDDYATKIRLAKEIASGLEYLHGARPRVVHHDMKPENIMLSENMHAKIIDFGLASTTTTIRTTMAGSAQSLEVKGTPGYMGPEKLIGDAKGATSHLGDVFAYGVVLWQLMTRREPYEGMEKRSIGEGIKAGKRPPFPTEIDFFAPGSALALLTAACWAGPYAERSEMGTVVACLRVCAAKQQASPVLVRALLDPNASIVVPGGSAAEKVGGLAVTSALLSVAISHSSQPALTLAGSAGAAAQAAGAEEVRGNICCCARFK
jgi:hypothetical protein